MPSAAPAARLGARGRPGSQPRALRRQPLAQSLPTARVRPLASGASRSTAQILIVVHARRAEPGDKGLFAMAQLCGRARVVKNAGLLRTCCSCWCTLVTCCLSVCVVFPSGWAVFAQAAARAAPLRVPVHILLLSCFPPTPTPGRAQAQRQRAPHPSLLAPRATPRVAARRRAHSRARCTGTTSTIVQQRLPSRPWKHVCTIHVREHIPFTCKEQEAHGSGGRCVLD